MISTNSFFSMQSPFNSFSANDNVFMKWLRDLEKEQNERGILSSTVINRQLLHYLWENGYNPIDALNELAGVDKNYQR